MELWIQGIWIRSTKLYLCCKFINLVETNNQYSRNVRYISVLLIYLGGNHQNLADILPKPITNILSVLTFTDTDISKSVDISVNRHVILDIHIPGGGGCSAKKYIPLLGRQRETPTLSGTKFAKSYPYWHKIWAQIHTLTGTNQRKRVPSVAQLCPKMDHGDNYWCLAPKIWPI